METGRIQDRYMIPHFRKGEYGQGIVAGFNAIVNEIYKEYGYTDRFVGDESLAEEGILPNEQTADDDDSFLSFVIVLAIIVVLIILDFSLFKGAITMMFLRSSARSRRGGLWKKRRWIWRLWRRRRQRRRRRKFKELVGKQKCNL